MQAWSLVWRGTLAFPERIEAWHEGPIVSELHRDQRYANSARVRAAEPLTRELQAHVERVLDAYGHLSADALMKLARVEDPWLAARHCSTDAARAPSEVLPDAMQRYYARSWAEAAEDAKRADESPAFRGSVADLEALLAAE